MKAPRAIRRVTKEVALRRVQRRESWPPALLAGQLGISARTVYRYLGWGLLRANGAGWVTSESVRKLLDPSVFGEMG